MVNYVSILFFWENGRAQLSTAFAQRLLVAVSKMEEGSWAQDAHDRAES
jgi:hypothetical protein